MLTYENFFWFFCGGENIDSSKGTLEIGMRELDAFSTTYNCKNQSILSENKQFSPPLKIKINYICDVILISDIFVSRQ